MIPTELTDAELAFPTSVKELLPDYYTLPEVFFHELSPYSRYIADLFYGKRVTSEFIAKDGIDSNAAWRHISYCLRSWVPKHEHKMAGCAYLLSLWFDFVGDQQ
jgi:hypothetical protein